MKYWAVRVHRQSTTIPHDAWCSEKSVWCIILLFQVLVLCVTISDWPLLLVGISFYSKSSSPKKLRDCSRIFFWQNIVEPSMAHINKKIHSSCQPSKLVWMRKRLSQQLMSSHKFAPLTLAITCTCLLGKTPIFPQLKYPVNFDQIRQKIVWYFKIRAVPLVLISLGLVL
jgi:hypothetical protein